MEGALSTESDSDSDSDLFLSAPMPPLQIVDDDGEYDMTTSQTLPNSAKTPRSRSILKTSREASGCELQARSSRSKSVTFSVPGDTPRKRKERNPILKVLEAFDRKFSHDCETSPSKPKLGIVERKHEEKTGSPNKSESNLPYWVTYLQVSQKRRYNQIERTRRADFKRDSSHVFTCRSSSLNSARNVESTRRRNGHPFWINGDDVDYRCTCRQCMRCSKSSQEKVDINNSTTPRVASNNSSNSNNNNNNVVVPTKNADSSSHLERKHQYWTEGRGGTCTAFNY